MVYNNKQLYASIDAEARILIIFPFLKKKLMAGLEGFKPASDKQRNSTRRTNNFSDPLSLPTCASANSRSAPIGRLQVGINLLIADSSVYVHVLDLFAHSC